MIFNIPGHIDMIRNGLCFLPADNLNSPAELRIIKTQTRRLNRGIYQIGKDYAVQRKRGVKAEPGMRILMDRIWQEDCLANDELGKGGFFLSISLSEEDAQAEGGYTPEEFERLFRELNPNWNGIIRYGFEFHVVEQKELDNGVQRHAPNITSHARHEERVKRILYPEQTAGYPRL